MTKKNIWMWKIKYKYIHRHLCQIWFKKHDKCVYVRVISWKIRICVKFSFFFNVKNGKQKLTIGFNFYILSKQTKMKNKIYVQFVFVFVFFFSEMWKPMFEFLFFSGHRKMKKQNKKKRKENVYLLLFFSEKWRIINLWSIFNENKLHAWCFFLFFVFVRCPNPLLLELNNMATIESLLDRGGMTGVIAWYWIN